MWEFRGGLVFVVGNRFRVLGCSVRVVVGFFRLFFFGIGVMNDYF